MAPCKDAAKSHEIRVLSQLCNLMDDLHESKSKLIVGGTCTDITSLDSSLRRPGRLNHEIYISVPSLEERKEILNELLKDKLAETIDKVAQVTPGYIGSDLASLARHLDPECSYDGIKKALKMVSPSGFKGGIGVVDVKAAKWEDIGGLTKVKTDLQSAILWPMKYPDQYAKLNIQRPKGVLLYGPPGCGKTSIVRAMASMSGATFLYVSAAAIFSPYVGDSEKAVAEVFHKARLGSPSILFIDEIEALVSTRVGKHESGVKERVLSVILNEMDGIGVKGCSGGELVSQVLIYIDVFQQGF